jgi:hypothetical protein
MYDFESYKAQQSSLVSYIANADKIQSEVKGVPSKQLRLSMRHEQKL